MVLLPNRALTVSGIFAAAGLFLPAAAAAAAAATEPAGLTNITVYRVSPLTYPGLHNMDTGDPSGDIGFGMWELMMPMDCRGGSRHMNIGCGGTTAGNGTGTYIKPGDPTNVYEEFVVEVNSLFGDYNDCNPILEGPQAGVFACEASDDGTHCTCPGLTSVDWEEWDDDCLNQGC
jgi:hypothetical protein